MSEHPTWSEQVVQDPLFQALVSVLEEEGVDLDDPARWDEVVVPALRSAVPAAADPLLSELKRTAPRMLCDWESVRWAFEKRLRKKWGRAFDLFQMLIVSCLELGEEINDTLRAEATEKEDYKFDVLTRLHARSCQTALEVQSLIESGYASGAHARWRTLHELAVVSVFIAEHDQELAERYLLHDRIESFRAIKQYEKHYEKLGYAPPDPAELLHLTKTYHRLRERFGKPFSRPYGWAAEVLGNPRPKFSQIEERVGLNHFRPFFKMASHGVHAGPKGILYNIGIPPDTSGILLAGSTDTGFADPAHGSALSLVQVTAAFVTTWPTLERLAMLQAAQGLTDEVGDAFLQTQRMMESQSSTKDLSPVPRGWRLRTALKRTLCRTRRLLRGVLGFGPATAKGRNDQ